LNNPKTNEIQEEIGSICENWFLKNYPHKERIVPQTISYFLLISLKDDAKLVGMGFFIFFFFNFSFFLKFNK